VSGGRVCLVPPREVGLTFCPVRPRRLSPAASRPPPLARRLQTLDLVSPLKLYLNWSLVIQRMQLWRLFTTFFFFGPLSLDWLFHMFFLQRYLRMLEINSFRGRTADLVYMLMFGASLLLAISPLTSIVFLGPSLTFMMVYVWARRNSRQVMNFLGVLSFRAPYLPWVLLLFSFVIGSPPSMDLLGVLAGHVYYYMADIYPAMAGLRLLKTPAFLVFLCGGEDEEIEDHDGVPPPGDAQPEPN
jgi:Derlin-2/3